MASTPKDKDGKKSGHRRSSSASKSGDKHRSSSSSSGHRSSSHKSSSPKATDSSQLPRRSSNRAVPPPATANTEKPATAAAPARSPASTAKPSALATKPAATPAAAPPAKGTTPAAAGAGARRASAPAGPAGGAPPKPATSGYGSMNANGPMGAYGSVGSFGYGSMYGGTNNMGGYGSMGPGGPMSGYGSMGPGGPMGSMYGMGGGYGSMAGGAEGGMEANPYGSMGGAENGMNGGMGSMYGGQGGMGSMYGMGGPMGSMYGMGGPMGGGMGSMYGMGGPMGSMYGMNPMMGSMYGMGGGMGSMYGMGGGMGSMYGLQRYNSMGLGSTYGSMYGIGRTSSRSSFRSSGGYVGGSFGGLWRAPSGMGKSVKKDYSIPPPSSKLVEEMPADDKEDAKKPVSGKAEEKKDDAKDGKAKVDEKASADTKDAKDGKAKVDEKAPEDKKESAKDAKDREGTKKDAATTSVVVVDKGGAAKDKEEKAKPRSALLALASSHRLTKQVNDSVHAVAVVPSEAMLSVADKKVKLGDSSFAMDEVAVSPLDVEKSDLLTDIVEQAHCGHNVSLLALCGSQPYAQSVPTVTAVVQRMMESFAAETTQVTQVLASAVVFAESDKIVDLLADKAEPVKAELGSNPIFGPCVLNTSEKKVDTAAEAVAVVTDAATKAEQRGLVVVVFKIKQIRPAAGSSPTRDVYVSSMLVAIVDDKNMVHVKAAEKHAGTGSAPLFGNAIGGASRTVVVVEVPKKDAETAVKEAAESAQQLREIKNTPTRSGNVKRFVDYTERAAAANAKTSPEITAKITRMLKDAKDLLANPEETALVAYPVSGPSHGSASPSAAAGEEAKKGAARTPRSIAKEGKEGKAATPKAANEKAPAGDESKRAEADRKVKLTVCVDGAKAMEVAGADEVVMRASPAEMPESAMLKVLCTNYGYGRNVALVSAETQKGVPLKDQYTWRCAESIVSKCLAEPASTAKATFIELSMVVVQKRQVLCDLLASASEPRPMAVASSPLFGPVIADSTKKVLTSAAEVKPAMEAALAGAPPHLTEADAMLVMTAVMKQVQQSGDVFVASFMCASGPSSAGVRGAMSKNPDYSRSLFAYTIGGPCVTGVLVCVGDDHDSNPAVKAALDDLTPLTKQPNHASRDGSVRAFLEYANKTLAANDAKLEKVAQEEEKARLKAASARLQMMHDDYKALMKFPAENTPACYVGDKRVTEAPRMGGKPGEDAAAGPSAAKSGEAPAKTPVPLRTVVVVVGDKAEEGAKPALEVTGTEVVLEGQRYTPTELVTLSGGNLHSAVIEEINKVALGGYNAAMLTNDVPGSTVGISMAVKSIMVLLRGLPEKSESFWTVVVSKGSKVKDMLAENSPYYDLHLASSPLFGNVAYGATISAVGEAQVEPMVREVRNEVRENGGVGYIYVILRLAQPNGDVCMPSFLVTIAGDNVEEYEKVLETRGNGFLLSTAVGGPCHTIHVAGLRGPGGEGAKPILELSRKMAKVSNAPLRSGSLKRFIAHTEPTLAAMQRKLEMSGGAANPALMAQVGRVGTMLKDARSMLVSPGGSAPAVYKR